MYFRKRQKTRTKLLDAAKQVMAGKGVEGTTIAEIAAAADVAPGTFYNYFTTRDIIREQIVAEGLTRGRFRLPSTRAVGDLITGTTVTALRSILERRVGVDVAGEVAELILRGLGVPFDEAHEIAVKPIPSLRPQGSGAAPQAAGHKLKTHRGNGRLKDTGNSPIGSLTEGARSSKQKEGNPARRRTREWR